MQAKKAASDALLGKVHAELLQSRSERQVTQQQRMHTEQQLVTLQTEIAELREEVAQLKPFAVQASQCQIRFRRRSSGTGTRWWTVLDYREGVPATFEAADADWDRRRGGLA